jgi:hypothetical protein
VKTVEIETVSDALRTPNTPLKQGVNEKWRTWSISRYEISGLRLFSIESIERTRLPEPRVF